MKISKLATLEQFTAGDNISLRELVNPHNHPDFTGRYSLAHGTLAPGQSSIPHKLDSHELYYILSGAGIIHIGQESGQVESGDAIEIPPGQPQWIENIGSGELAFLCIVDPGWRPEDEQIL